MWKKRNATISSICGSVFEHVVEHVVAIGVSRVRQMQKAECYPCIRKRKMGGEWRLFMAPMPRVYTYYYYLQEHLPVDSKIR